MTADLDDDAVTTRQDPRRHDRARRPGHRRGRRPTRSLDSTSPPSTWAPAPSAPTSSLDGEVADRRPGRRRRHHREDPRRRGRLGRPGRATRSSLGKIATGAVDSRRRRRQLAHPDDLADNSVGPGELAAGSVVAGKIGTNAVGTGNIADTRSTSDNSRADSVSASHICTNAVGNDELASDAVDTAELVDGAVTTAKIADGAVTNAKLADRRRRPAPRCANGSLTADDIAGGGAGGPLAGQIALDPPSITADHVPRRSTTA